MDYDKDADLEQASRCWQEELREHLIITNLSLPRRRESNDGPELLNSCFRWNDIIN